MRKRFGREGSEFGRGLGFFDAIYGFAITLLVTNIDVPPAEAWNSLPELFEHGIGSQLLGFAISFIVIAVFWRNNTELLGRFRAMDGPVITANLVTAAFVVMIPFTTQGISDPEVNGYPLPTALYALNVALVILSHTMMLEIGRSHGLLDEDVPKSAVWTTRVDVGAQIAVFLVSIPVAYLFGANWGQLTWVLLFVVARITGKWSARVAQRAAASADPHA